jgi:hypothetical protein
MHVTLMLFRFGFSQILRNRKFQSRRDWRQQTESGHRARSGFHSKLQARKPDDVCMGDPRQIVGRRRLHSRQRAQRFVDQPVSFTYYEPIALRMIVEKTNPT